MSTLKPLLLLFSVHMGVLIVPAFTDQLQPGTPQIVTLPENDVIYLDVTGVTATSSFLLIQVYGHHSSLKLTDVSESPSVSISGASLGMVKMLGGSAGTPRWTLMAGQGNEQAGANATNSTQLVLVFVQEYAANVPVPGGCNQVFDLELDPNIRLTTARYQTQVWYQWAGAGTQRGVPSQDCELSASRMSYQVYVTYLVEGKDSRTEMFDTIRSMMTVEQIQKKGQKLVSVSNDGSQKSLTTVTAQASQGAVYSVVVRDDASGLSAGYVSTVTYGCNYTAGHCRFMEKDAVEWVMVTACIVVGLVLTLLGHQFLKTELFVFGFLAMMLICYNLLAMSTDRSEAFNLAVAAAIGVAGGGVWLGMWLEFRFPTVSVLLPGLCAGYLLAGTVFFTPFANISWWGSDLNYGLVFTCLTLLFAVGFMCVPRAPNIVLCALVGSYCLMATLGIVLLSSLPLIVLIAVRHGTVSPYSAFMRGMDLAQLNIISCALVGSYCLVAALGIALRSSLPLIVLVAVRHAAVGDYSKVLLVYPFQLTDIMLSLAWVLLTGATIVLHALLSWGRPPFPDQHRRRGRGNGPHVRDGVVSRRSGGGGTDECSPLLGDESVPTPSYDTINESQRHPTELGNPLSQNA